MIAEEFWVINWEGAPLFTFSFDDSQSRLLSGFFQTIQSFARNIIDDDQDHINYITLGEYIYNFHRNTIYQLYFIIKCSSKTKRKTIKARLSTIENLFIEDYRAELVKPDRDPSQFEKFRSKIEKYFDPNILIQMENNLRDSRIKELK